MAYKEDALLARDSMLDFPDGDGIPPTQPPRKPANDAYVILGSGRRGHLRAFCSPGLNLFRIWVMASSFSIDVFARYLPKYRCRGGMVDTGYASVGPADGAPLTWKFKSLSLI